VTKLRLSKLRGSNLLLGLIAFGIGALLMFQLLQTHRQLSPPDSSNESARPKPEVNGMPPGEAAMTLGNWYFDQHAWKPAIVQYENAIRAGLDNPDLRTDLGSAYRFSGDPEKAIEQYETAQKRNPNHENSLFDLAALYLQSKKDPARASALLEEFIRRFPQSGARLRAEELLKEAKK
jgi:tetratricopeptide (TPR) repeat protein